MNFLPISAFTARTHQITDWTRRLVELESPTHDKAAVDRLGGVLGEALQALDAQVRLEPRAAVGNAVVAGWDGMANGDSAGGLLVLGHLDTVYDVGTLARQPCRVDDGRLLGPGTLDMKASLAMLLVALEALRAEGRWPARPITVLLTPDEETGSHASRGLIEALASQAALVLCLEPALPDGALKTWRKGTGRYVIRAEGKAAHAGADHERGRNAIEELAHHVLAAQKLTDYAAGTTVNVGVIRGGSRANVVPEAALAELDVRVLTHAEAERVARWMAARRPVLAGTTLAVTGGLNRPPMPRDNLMAATFQRAQGIAAELGLELAEGGTGGGSDANFVAPLGVPVLDGLGAIGTGAHSPREHILIRHLPERTALLAALIAGW